MNGSKEQDFWPWFQQNEELLFDFERDREGIFDALGAALDKVSPDLTFEFGHAENNVRDFVISAGGIESAFPLLRLYMLPRRSCCDGT